MLPGQVGRHRLDQRLRTRSAGVEADSLTEKATIVSDACDILAELFLGLQPRTNRLAPLRKHPQLLYRALRRAISIGILACY